MRHEILTITPEVAAEMLQRPFTRQRNVTASTVAKYARAMKEGRWKEPTIDPIALTKAGELLNGQHRLRAVIESGVTVNMLVAQDVDTDLFDVIDTPKKREASQFIRRENAQTIASAAKFILWYYNRRLADKTAPAHPTNATLAFDNDVLLAFVDGEVGDTLEAAAFEARRVYRGSGIPAGIHAAILTIARRQGADENRIVEWLEGVGEGVGLEREDPRRLLRNRFSGPYGIAIRKQFSITWTLVVRAFNAWMQGRTMRALIYDASEAPPPIDITGSVASNERRARSHRRTRSSSSTGTSSGRMAASE